MDYFVLLLFKRFMDSISIWLARLITSLLPYQAVLFIAQSAELA